MEKTKLKLSPKEYIWYIIAGALAIWGLVEIVLGIVVLYIPQTASDNVLLQMEKAYKAAFGLGFLPWGLILLGIGILLGVIVLCACSTKGDKKSEKTSRRAARRTAMFTEEPIEAEVKDVDKA